MLALAVVSPLLASAYAWAPVGYPRSAAAAASRTSLPAMDETIIEKALAGELEEEGAANVFMSEVGWATYLDKACGSSYNLNQRVSVADDGYFTPDIFSNPADGEYHCLVCHRTALISSVPVGNITCDPDIPVSSLLRSDYVVG